MAKATNRVRKGIEAPPGLAIPQIVNDLTRRDFLVASGAAMLLGGCGGGGSEEADSSGETRTIEHKFGETEVSGKPERVVTVGVSEQDPALALGVTPVGVTEWFGEQPFAVWPWARGELGDAEPEVLELGDLNLEAIAALRPDLIVGTNSGMGGEDYDRLAEIAPTLAQSDEYADYNMPWQEQTSVIGRALGRRREAEELIARVESRIAKARERLAEYAGASAVLVNGGPAEGVINVYTSSSKNGRLLTALGFEVPEEFDELAEGGDQAVISLERLDLLDRDLLVWNLGLFGDRAEIEAIPLYQQLDAVNEGRDMFITNEEPYAAIGFSTVLSLPYAIDQLVPMLTAAIDGDPETEAPS